jgi:hypothetical protein
LWRFGQFRTSGELPVFTEEVSRPDVLRSGKVAVINLSILEAAYGIITVYTALHFAGTIKSKP